MNAHCSVRVLAHVKCATRLQVFWGHVGDRLILFEKMIAFILVAVILASCIHCPSTKHRQQHHLAAMPIISSDGSCDLFCKDSYSKSNVKPQCAFCDILLYKRASPVAFPSCVGVFFFCKSIILKHLHFLIDIVACAIVCWINMYVFACFHFELCMQWRTWRASCGSETFHQG